MTTPTHGLPAGYWQNAKGNLVRIDAIKPIDKMRDEMVRDIVDKARRASTVLRDFKTSTFGDIQSFIDLSAEQYGVRLGGEKKGNITLSTFDGRYKVMRANADNITFDERLEAAKALIDECLNEWTEGARPELQAFVTQAFSTDKKGQINTGRVLSLRRFDIQDARWQRAMDAISDAVQVVGSTSYIRVYERVGDSDQYRPIPLDLAGV